VSARPGQEGQAAIEMVGLLPLLVVAALAVGQVLAAGAARGAAQAAAQAAAMALVQGGDPVAHARAAAPDWSRDRLTVRIHGRAVRARIVPRTVLPGTAGLLTATAEADAGPAS
jgi:hypothetical protein